MAGHAHRGPPSGRSQDLNWGRYSGFTSYSTAAAANPQDFCATETAVFEYADPDEDKNRMFSRNFSRNLAGHDETLLVQESVGFKSGTGFPQQSQVLSRERGLWPWPKPPVRSLQGHDALADHAGSARKTGPELPARPDPEFRGYPTYFRRTLRLRHLFGEPEAMSQTATASVGRYWSDEENPDDRIPSAEGYPSPLWNTRATEPTAR